MVVIKFNEVKKLEIPDIARPTMIKSTLRGDKVINDVDSGGYSVHPVPAPNSVSSDNISIPKETGSSSKDILFIRGKDTSADPLNTGMK